MKNIFFIFLCTVVPIFGMEVVPQITFKLVKDQSTELVLPANFLTLYVNSRQIMRKKMTIAGKRVPKFKPGKALKALIQ